MKQIKFALITAMLIPTLLFSGVVNATQQHEKATEKTVFKLEQ
jgi:hypothetical protein